MSHQLTLSQAGLGSHVSGLSGSSRRTTRSHGPPPPPPPFPSVNPGGSNHSSHTSPHHPSRISTIRRHGSSSRSDITRPARRASNTASDPVDLTLSGDDQSPPRAAAAAHPRSNLSILTSLPQVDLTEHLSPQPQFEPDPPPPPTLKRTTRPAFSSSIPDPVKIMVTAAIKSRFNPSNTSNTPPNNPHMPSRSASSSSHASSRSAATVPLPTPPRHPDHTPSRSATTGGTVDSELASYALLHSSYHTKELEPFFLHKKNKAIRSESVDHMSELAEVGWKLNVPWMYLNLNDKNRLTKNTEVDGPLWLHVINTPVQTSEETAWIGQLDQASNFMYSSPQPLVIPWVSVPDKCPLDATTSLAYLLQSDPGYDYTRGIYTSTPTCVVDPVSMFNKITFMSKLLQSNDFYSGLHDRMEGKTPLTFARLVRLLWAAFMKIRCLIPLHRSSTIPSGNIGTQVPILGSMLAGVLGEFTTGQHIPPGVRQRLVKSTREADDFYSIFQFASRLRGSTDSNDVQRAAATVLQFPCLTAAERKVILDSRPIRGTVSVYPGLHDLLYSSAEQKTTLARWQTHSLQWLLDEIGLFPSCGQSSADVRLKVYSVYFEHHIAALCSPMFHAYVRELIPLGRCEDVSFYRTIQLLLKRALYFRLLITQIDTTHALAFTPLIAPPMGSDFVLFSSIKYQFVPELVELQQRTNLQADGSIDPAIFPSYLNYPAISNDEFPRICEMAPCTLSQSCAPEYMDMYSDNSPNLLSTIPGSTPEQLCSALDTKHPNRISLSLLVEDHISVFPHKQKALFDYIQRAVLSRVYLEWLEHKVVQSLRITPKSVVTFPRLIQLLLRKLALLHERMSSTPKPVPITNKFTSVVSNPTIIVNPPESSEHVFDLIESLLRKSNEHWVDIGMDDPQSIKLVPPFLECRPMTTEEFNDWSHLTLPHAPPEGSSSAIEHHTLLAQGHWLVLKFLDPQTSNVQLYDSLAESLSKKSFAVVLVEMVKMSKIGLTATRVARLLALRLFNARQALASVPHPSNDDSIPSTTQLAELPTSESSAELTPASVTQGQASVEPTHATPASTIAPLTHPAAQTSTPSAEAGSTTEVVSQASILPSTSGATTPLPSFHQLIPTELSRLRGEGVNRPLVLVVGSCAPADGSVDKSAANGLRFAGLEKSHICFYLDHASSVLDYPSGRHFGCEVGEKTELILSSPDAIKSVLTNGQLVERFTFVIFDFLFKDKLCATARTINFLLSKLLELGVIDVNTQTILPNSKLIHSEHLAYFPFLGIHGRRLQLTTPHDLFDLAVRLHLETAQQSFWYSQHVESGVDSRLLSSSLVPFHSFFPFLRLTFVIMNQQEDGTNVSEDISNSFKAYSNAWEGLSDFVPTPPLIPNDDLISMVESMPQSRDIHLSHSIVKYCHQNPLPTGSRSVELRCEPKLCELGKPTQLGLFVSPTSAAFKKGDHICYFGGLVGHLSEYSTIAHEDERKRKTLHGFHFESSVLDGSPIRQRLVSYTPTTNVQLNAMVALPGSSWFVRPDTLQPATLASIRDCGLGFMANDPGVCKPNARYEKFTYSRVGGIELQLVRLVATKPILPSHQILVSYSQPARRELEHFIPLHPSAHGTDDEGDDDDSEPQDGEDGGEHGSGKAAPNTPSHEHHDGHEDEAGNQADGDDSKSQHGDGGDEDDHDPNDENGGDEHDGDKDKDKDEDEDEDEEEDEEEEEDEDEEEEEEEKEDDNEDAEDEEEDDLRTETDARSGTTSRIDLPLSPALPPADSTVPSGTDPLRLITAPTDHVPVPPITATTGAGSEEVVNAPTPSPPARTQPATSSTPTVTPTAKATEETPKTPTASVILPRGRDRRNINKQRRNPRTGMDSFMSQEQYDTDYALAITSATEGKPVGFYIADTPGKLKLVVVQADPADRGKPASGRRGGTGAKLTLDIPESDEEGKGEEAEAIADRHQAEIKAKQQAKRSSTTTATTATKGSSASGHRGKKQHTGDVDTSSLLGSDSQLLVDGFDEAQLNAAIEASIKVAAEAKEKQEKAEADLLVHSTKDEFDILVIEQVDQIERTYRTQRQELSNKLKDVDIDDMVKDVQLLEDEAFASKLATEKTKLDSQDQLIHNLRKRVPPRANSKRTTYYHRIFLAQEENDAFLRMHVLRTMSTYKSDEFPGQLLPKFSESMIPSMNGAVYFIHDYEQMTQNRDPQGTFPLLPVRIIQSPSTKQQCGAFSLNTVTFPAEVLKRSVKRDADGQLQRGKLLSGARKLKARWVELLTRMRDEDPAHPDPDIQMMFKQLKSDHSAFSPEDFSLRIKEAIDTLQDDVPVDSIVLSLTSFIYQISLRYFWPYWHCPAKERTNRVGKSHQYHHGLLVADEGTTMYFPDAARQNEGWNWDSKRQDSPHGILLKTRPHWDAMVRAPDLLLALNHPNMPLGWVPSILYPTNQHVGNRSFFAPYFLAKQILSPSLREKLTAPQAASITPMVHVRLYDLVEYFPPGDDHVEIGIVTTIVLKLHEPNDVWIKHIRRLDAHMKENSTPTQEQLDELEMAAKALETCHVPQFHFIVMPLRFIAESTHEQKKQTLFFVDKCEELSPDSALEPLDTNLQWYHTILPQRIVRAVPYGDQFASHFRKNLPGTVLKLVPKVLHNRHVYDVCQWPLGSEPRLQHAMSALILDETPTMGTMVRPLSEETKDDYSTHVTHELFKMKAECDASRETTQADGKKWSQYEDITSGPHRQMWYEGIMLCNDAPYRIEDVRSIILHYKNYNLYRPFRTAEHPNISAWLKDHGAFRSRITVSLPHADDYRKILCLYGHGDEIGGMEPKMRKLANGKEAEDFRQLMEVWDKYFHGAGGGPVDKRIPRIQGLLEQLLESIADFTRKEVELFDSEGHQGEIDELPDWTLMTAEQKAKCTHTNPKFLEPDFNFVDAPASADSVEIQPPPAAATKSAPTPSAPAASTTKKPDSKAKSKAKEAAPAASDSEADKGIDSTTKKPAAKAKVNLSKHPATPVSEAESEIDMTMPSDSKQTKDDSTPPATPAGDSQEDSAHQSKYLEHMGPCVCRNLLTAYPPQTSIIPVMGSKCAARRSDGAGWMGTPFTLVKYLTEGDRCFMKFKSNLFESWIKPEGVIGGRNVISQVKNAPHMAGIVTDLLSRHDPLLYEFLDQRKDNEGSLKVDDKSVLSFLSKDWRTSSNKLVTDFMKTYKATQTRFASPQKQRVYEFIPTIDFFTEPVLPTDYKERINSLSTVPPFPPEQTDPQASTDQAGTVPDVPTTGRRTRASGKSEVKDGKIDGKDAGKAGIKDTGAPPPLPSNTTASHIHHPAEPTTLPSTATPTVTEADGKDVSKVGGKDTATGGSLPLSSTTNTPIEIQPPGRTTTPAAPQSLTTTTTPIQPPAKTTTPAVTSTTNPSASVGSGSKRPADQTALELSEEHLVIDKKLKLVEEQTQLLKQQEALLQQRQQAFEETKAKLATAQSSLEASLPRSAIAPESLTPSKRTHEQTESTTTSSAPRVQSEPESKKQKTAQEETPAWAVTLMEEFSQLKARVNTITPNPITTPTTPAHHSGTGVSGVSSLSAPGATPSANKNLFPASNLYASSTESQGTDDPKIREYATALLNLHPPGASQTPSSAASSIAESAGMLALNEDAQVVQSTTAQVARSHFGAAYTPAQFADCRDKVALQVAAQRFQPATTQNVASQPMSNTQTQSSSSLVPSVPWEFMRGAATCGYVGGVSDMLSGLRQLANQQQQGFNQNTLQWGPQLNALLGTSPSNYNTAVNAGLIHNLQPILNSQQNTFTPHFTPQYHNGTGFNFSLMAGNQSPFQSPFTPTTSDFPSLFSTPGRR